MLTNIDTYRVHPHALVFASQITEGRSVVLECSSSIPPLKVKDARFLWALILLPARFSKENAIELWRTKNVLSSVVEHIWEAGLHYDVLVPADDASFSTERFDRWGKFSWNEASRYHEATRDYPFVRPGTPNATAVDDERMRQYIESDPPPNIYQEFVHLALSIPLNRLHRNESANETVMSLDLTERRGHKGLSVLLDVCFGERDRLCFGRQGQYLHKAIPSGGARHPTEVFLAAFALDGIDPGLYHYNVRLHQLDCLHAGNMYNEFQQATFDLFKKFDQRPVALLVFTSLNKRSMWRYRDPRSWRAVLIDIGHAVMAYRQVALKLGFRYYTYQKFDDRRVCELIGINAFVQTPFYVGTLV